MDTTEETRRTALDYVDSLEQRDWPRWSALLADDVVYEMPQTRERVHGRDGFVRFNVEYPGDWHLAVRRVVADGRYAALWLDVRVAEDRMDACVWLEIGADGTITKVTDYWPDPYEPPAGREHLVERY
ncbi:nuclear transport factor 2 family protein [Hamadaea sp. NPDC051192]|uniref:nuclear transport factor 2 family protein n=1 Tax=Hamadaea sp. NPDC051192 TaxID=3154940 RepID=UPI003447C89D